MKLYHVYIVQCGDGLFYTGFTSDLEKRIMEHNSGKHSDAFTYMRRPVELKWYEQFSEPQQAIEVEKKIKGWSRKKKIAIIENRWGDLPNLSKNYTQHGSSTGSD